MNTVFATLHLIRLGTLANASLKSLSQVTLNYCVKLLCTFFVVIEKTIFKVLHSFYNGQTPLDFLYRVFLIDAFNPFTPKGFTIDE